MSKPFYFGTEGRRLYGIYTPPAARPVSRGVVLCAPWGQEYIRAHRPLRILADALARRGLHVLRFDYYGMGDSAGETWEVELEGCLDDATSALNELVGITGVRRVGLVGLRLGAVVAARAAATEAHVRRLALWDPIVDGVAYALELGRVALDPWSGAGAAEATLPGMPPAPGWREVDGFPLTRSLLSAVSRIRPGDYGSSRSVGTLLAVTEETEEVLRLRAGLEEQLGVHFEYAFRPGARAWRQERDFGAGAVPSALIRCLASWSW